MLHFAPAAAGAAANELFVKEKAARSNGGRRVDWVLPARLELRGRGAPVAVEAHAGGRDLGLNLRAIALERFFGADNAHLLLPKAAAMVSSFLDGLRAIHVSFRADGGLASVQHVFEEAAVRLRSTALQLGNVSKNVSRETELLTSGHIVVRHTQIRLVLFL